MYIRFNNRTDKSIKPFLINQSVDGVYSTRHFNSFICKFDNFHFGNVPNHSLVQLFKNGSNISPFLAYWLNENTNLILIPGNKKACFIDENNKFYQLKTFTESGTTFRPSIQQGGGRYANQQRFKDYCRTRSFILASVVKFPIVKFKIFSGEFLLETYPSGNITFDQQNTIFDF